MKPFIALLSLLCLISPSQAEESANLLTNPNFADWSNDKPTAWVAPGGQKITPITDATVEGVSTGIKVEVVTDGGEKLGEIRQSIKAVSGSRYRFEGMFESTKPGLCIFVIKLRSGKTELKRISTKEKSSSQWTMASIEFETAEASEIQVLCRYDQSSPFVGSTGSFTKLKLVKLD